MSARTRSLHLYLILGIVVVGVTSRRETSTDDIIWYPVDEEDGVFVSIYGEKYATKWEDDIRRSRVALQNFHDESIHAKPSTRLTGHAGGKRTKRQAPFGGFQPWNVEIPGNPFFNFQLNPPLQPDPFHNGQVPDLINEFNVNNGFHRAEGFPVSSPGNQWPTFPNQIFSRPSVQNQPEVPFINNHFPNPNRPQNYPNQNTPDFFNPANRPEPPGQGPNQLDYSNQNTPDRPTYPTQISSSRPNYPTQTTQNRPNFPNTNTQNSPDFFNSQNQPNYPAQGSINQPHFPSPSTPSRPTYPTQNPQNRPNYPTQTTQNRPNYPTQTTQNRPNYPNTSTQNSPDFFSPNTQNRPNFSGSGQYPGFPSNNENALNPSPNPNRPSTYPQYENPFFYEQNTQNPITNQAGTSGSTGFARPTNNEGGLVFPEDVDTARQTSSTNGASRPTTTPTTSTATSTEPTTLSPCERNCPVTPQFNPVCGTDSVTYSNIGRLKCAQNCGKAVGLSHYGNCRGSRLAMPPRWTRPRTSDRFFHF